MSYLIPRKSAEALFFLIFLTVIHAYPSFAWAADDCILAQATPQRAQGDEDGSQTVSDLSVTDVDESGSTLAQFAPQTAPSYRYSSFASEDALLSTSSANLDFGSPTDASTPMIGSATAIRADVSGGPVAVLAISLTGLLFAAIGIAVRDTYLRRADIANQDGAEANESGSALAS